LRTCLAPQCHFQNHGTCGTMVLKVALLGEPDKFTSGAGEHIFVTNLSGPPQCYFQNKGTYNGFDSGTGGGGRTSSQAERENTLFVAPILSITSSTLLSSKRASSVPLIAHRYESHKMIKLVSKRMRRILHISIRRLLTTINVSLKLR